MPSFRERPILFSGLMVSAILEGRKTQTRRVIASKHSGPLDGEWIWDRWQAGYPDGRYRAVFEYRGEPIGLVCPYGQLRDRLWVRETWAWPGEEEILYRADQWSFDLVEKWKTDPNYPQIKWSPAIFMRRRHSRITLEVTGVRAERLHEITGADLLAEGIAHGMGGFGAFEKYWDELHAKGDGVVWAANPWVWRIEFRRIEQTSDEKQPAVSI